MAKQDTQVIEMLKELAAKEVDEATQSLALAMKAADAAKAQQETLNQYRLDYVQNLNQALKNGMGAEVYQNFRHFFDRLDQAILGQQEVVLQTSKQVNIQKKLWQECQRKKLSYEVLAARAYQRVKKDEQKRDQKMMDEFAMRATRHRH